MCLRIQLLGGGGGVGELVTQTLMLAARPQELSSRLYSTTELTGYDPFSSMVSLGLLSLWSVWHMLEPGSLVVRPSVHLVAPKLPLPCSLDITAVCMGSRPKHT